MRNATLTMRLIYIGLFLCLATSATAQWTGSTTTATRVCTAAGDQTNPYTVPNGSGGSIVVWQDERNTSYDIYIDNLSSTGTPLWSTVDSYAGKAVCTATGSQYINDLIIDPSGNVFVVWEDNRVSNNTNVYIQKFSSSGVAQWTTNGVLLVNAAATEFGARLASDGAGGVIAAWADFRNDAVNEENPETYVQRLSSTGAAMWTANGINIFTGGLISFPSDVIADGSGGAIIALSDIRNSTVNGDGEHSNIDISAQRVSPAGALLWGNTGVAVCAQTSNQINQNYSTVSDGSGGVIMYWNDYRNDPNNGNNEPYNDDIYAQRINASGNALWTANGVAISTAPQQIGSFKVISDGAGGAVATWVDYTYNSSTFTYNSAIKTQRTNATGTNSWLANGITVSSFSDQYPFIDCAIDNVGGVIFTWSRTNTGDNRIIAHRLNMATGTFTWPAGGVVVNSSTTGLYSPSISTGSTGEAIIVWEDFRNNATTGADIYANKVNNNGTLPLIWGNITALLKGNNGVISWQTLQEINTAKFDVEKSEDGNSYTIISSVTAAGNSASAKTYEAFDKDILKFTGKTFFYRIKQTDIDGKTTFSKVVRLTIPKNASYIKLLNNPVASEARLLYMAAENGKGSIRIMDPHGRILYTKQQAIVKGANQFTLATEKFATGAYFIEVVQGSFKQTIQMLK